MSKLLISTGAAFSAVGLIATVPASATTLSFGFQTDTSAEIIVNPLLTTLDDITIPEAIDVSATGVSGSFTVLDDITQVTDGDIELGYELVGGLLGDSYDATLDALLSSLNLTPEQALETADTLFTVTQFSGSGILTSDSFDVAGDPNNPSPFNISYNNQTNAVVIDGYSNKVATTCFWSDCGITANVSYGVGVVIGELVTLTDELLTNPAIELSAEASNTIKSLQDSASMIQLLNPSLETLELATVLADISATTEFIRANPPGSAADQLSAEVTSGALTVSTTTNGQKEQIYSGQYGETTEPTVAAENWGDLEADAIVKTAAVDPSLQESLSFVADTPIIAQLATDAGDTEDVPEPSIIVGLLGAAWAVKQSRRNSVG
ncbi:MAG: hypothetical protein AAGI69_11110 [Cyanobacteria bacterium P01_H01_bin.21]